MLTRKLTKLAETAHTLRAVAKIKQSGLLGTVASGIAKHPVGTALAGLGAYGTVTGAVGKTRQFSAGFNPATRNIV